MLTMDVVEALGKVEKKIDLEIDKARKELGRSLAEVEREIRHLNLRCDGYTRRLAEETGVRDFYGEEIFNRLEKRIKALEDRHTLTIHHHGAHFASVEDRRRDPHREISTTCPSCFHKFFRIEGRPDRLCTDCSHCRYTEAWKRSRRAMCNFEGHPGWMMYEHAQECKGFTAD